MLRCICTGSCKKEEWKAGDVTNHCRVEATETPTDCNAIVGGRTVRRSDATCALRIHLSTAHCWRHHFLAAPKTIQPQALTGIADAEKTMFLLSFKGKRSGLDRKALKLGRLG